MNEKLKKALQDLQELSELRRIHYKRYVNTQNTYFDARDSYNRIDGEFEKQQIYVERLKNEEK